MVRAGGAMHMRVRAVTSSRMPAAMMTGWPVTTAPRTEPGDRHGAKSDTAERETECVEIHRSGDPPLLTCARDTIESYVPATGRARGSRRSEDQTMACFFGKGKDSRLPALYNEAALGGGLTTRELIGTRAGLNHRELPRG